MSTSVKEPYASRGRLAKESWFHNLSAFQAFTFDEVDASDWRRRLSGLPHENGGFSNGMNLAMIPEMLRLFPNASWYVQADDDTMLFPKSLAAKLALLPAGSEQKPLLLGKCVGYPPLQIGFCTCGASMVFSRRLMEDLAPHVLRCRKEHQDVAYGDARVGACGADLYGKNHWTYNVVTCLNEDGFSNDGVTESFLNDFSDDAHVISMHVKDSVASATLWNDLQGKAQNATVTWGDVRTAAHHVMYNWFNGPTG